MAEDLNMEPCGRCDCDCCPYWWRREDALRAEVSSLRSSCSSLQSEVERLRAERDLLRGEIATAADCANTWARETGVQESLDPFVCLNLKNLIDRLWSESSLKIHSRTARERRYVEALEIARRMADDNQNHLEDLNGPKPCPAECDACQLRKALSPAPGSQDHIPDVGEKVVSYMGIICPHCNGRFNFHPTCDEQAKKDEGRKE